MAHAMKTENAVMTKKPISRSELRNATIHGVARVKSDPGRLRLTSGQRAHITRKK